MLSLQVTDPLHVGQWGVSVTTPQVTKQKATVNVITTLENANNSEMTTVTLRIKLLGPTGKILQAGETNIQLAAGAKMEVPLTVEVKSPPLWSLDAPALCQAKVEILAGGKMVDAINGNLLASGKLNFPWRTVLRTAVCR